MSIKGFIINGELVLYDYDDLADKPTIPSPITVDSSLSDISENPVQNKVIKVALDQKGKGTGVSDELKAALLQLAEKVAYVDGDGQTYYQDLYDALYSSVVSYSVTNNLTNVTNSNSTSSVTEESSYIAHLSWASDYAITTVSITMGGNDVTGTYYSNGTISIPNVTGNIVITAVATQRQANLLSIDAVFTQGQTAVYPTTSLNDLKQYLVVTAYWDDSTTSIVAANDYTLSGTLTVGTSTVTVSYGGKTDTFTVTVTEAPPIPVAYRQVEYIQRTPWATTSDFINTGVVLSGTGTAVFDAEFMLTTPTLYGTDPYYVFDVRENVSSSNSVGFGVAYNAACDSVYSFAGGSTASINLGGSAMNQKLSVQATVNSSGWTISDGTSTNSVTATPRAYANSPICLFGAKKTTNQVNTPLVGKIYYFKVTENDVVKMELVPCVRISDDAVGFYDRVNEAFYTGTGLLAGEIVQTDTTADLEYTGYVLEHKNSSPYIVNTERDNGGITITYSLDNPSTVLDLSGIVPNITVLQSSMGCIAIYDSNDTFVNYVNQASRWAQAPSASMTEFNQSWNVSTYSKIKFSLDIRYLDYAYMYDHTTGQVYYAGAHTPYYGMSNISEAS